MKNVIISSPDIYDDTAQNLKAFGYDVKSSCKNSNVLPSLAYHVDMQLVKISVNKLVSAPECYDYYTHMLKKYGIDLICGNTFLSCNYPGDIAYNIIIGENYAIHNFKYTDSVLKGLIEPAEFINISQGYTACTLCRLSDYAYITSDSGIYKILSEKFDVLLIDDSNVVLPGFDHGFFGGSSFMLTDDTLAVNGDIKTHKSHNEIKSFALNYGIHLLSLSKNPIMDIGSFVIM